MRRLPWRSAIAVVLAILAAWWVAEPVPSPDGRPVQSVPLVARPAAPVPDRPPERARYASPIRYAFIPACDDGSGPCRNWNLVSADGERGWLPGADAASSLTLSPDGTRALYRHGEDDRYVVADLRTGRLTPLAVRDEDGSVGEIFGAQPPRFSLDGRHLVLQPDHLDEDDELVLERPLIVDLGNGSVRRLPRAGRVAGWTRAGLVTVISERADDLPGHPSRARFTVYSPQGRAVRTYTLPGNLAEGTFPSPSGDLLASVLYEAADGGRTGTGVTLTGTASGRSVRTVLPRLPPGWRIRSIVRWDGEGELIVITRGPSREPAYHVLDLATGGVRRIELDLAGVANYPLQPAELSTVLAAVDRS
ncbi:hypothetical protein [Nonomuraea sp. NPDC050783]|uniref:hypothetical protein n=1 Tax=Nonomuraea sp. NPDC050783 TaxID=3154634 RepID=UPI003466E37A